MCRLRNSLQHLLVVIFFCTNSGTGIAQQSPIAPFVYDGQNWQYVPDLQSEPSWNPQNYPLSKVVPNPNIPSYGNLNSPPNENTPGLNSGTPPGSTGNPAFPVPNITGHPLPQLPSPRQVSPGNPIIVPPLTPQYSNQWLMVQARRGPQEQWQNILRVSSLRLASAYAEQLKLRGMEVRVINYGN